LEIDFDIQNTKNGAYITNIVGEKKGGRFRGNDGTCIPNYTALYTKSVKLSRCLPAQYSAQLFVNAVSPSYKLTCGSFLFVTEILARCTWLSELVTHAYLN
jgi:hypothetical protein